MRRGLPLPLLIGLFVALPIAPPQGAQVLAVQESERDWNDALLAGLRWLARHQHPDGHWSAHDFLARCKDPEHACHYERKELDYSNRRGRGAKQHDVGVTALAVLAYLGYGHTHKKGERRDFVAVMEKARQWLLAQQVKTEEPDAGGPNTAGRIGSGAGDRWIYDHALATMALSELLVLSRDRRTGLPEAVAAATELCLRWQQPDGGWRYEFQGGSDSSVTAWMILALKTSRMGSEMRLSPIPKQHFDPPFEKARKWFARATNEEGRTGYTAPGDPGSRVDGAYADPYPFSSDVPCLTAMSVLSRLFIRVKKDDPSIRKGIEIVASNVPEWRPATGKQRSTIDFCYWYFGTYSMFQLYSDDKYEATWLKALRKSLFDTQRIGGCEDGSWDPMGEWGAIGGRVYATALACMAMEVEARRIRTRW